MADMDPLPPTTQAPVPTDVVPPGQPFFPPVPLPELPPIMPPLSLPAPPSAHVGLYGHMADIDTEAVAGVGPGEDPNAHVLAQTGTPENGGMARADLTPDGMNAEAALAYQNEQMRLRLAGQGTDLLNNPDAAMQGGIDVVDDNYQLHGEASGRNLLTNPTGDAELDISHQPIPGSDLSLRIAAENIGQPGQRASASGAGTIPFGSGGVQFQGGIATDGTPSAAVDVTQQITDGVQVGAGASVMDRDGDGQVDYEVHGGVNGNF